jgi:hypothetical protein
MIKIAKSIKQNSYNMKKLKIFSALLMFAISFQSISQISLNAGTGFVKGFTVPKPFFGFQGGIELPRSNDETFYGRIGYYFPQKEDLAFSTYVTAVDVNTQPSVLTVNYVTKTNYFTIEGGTRRYLGNDYDNGFSLYGGTNAMLVFNTVKRDYEKYDATGTYQWEPNYQTSPNEQNKGNVLSLAVGLQGGLKYTIPATGTLYFDINGQYAIFGKANNVTASNTNLYSQLFFTFNVGFRKDLY